MTFKAFGQISGPPLRVVDIKTAICVFSSICAGVQNECLAVNRTKKKGVDGES